MVGLYIPIYPRRYASVHNNHYLLSEMDPSCLSAAIQYVNVFVQTGHDYIIPWTRTKFGDRAFSVAGPKVWNSLP